MNSNKLLPLLAAALAALCLPSCETPEPRDPKTFLPGKPEYYNEAFRFSLRYPGVLNLKVEDKDVAGRPALKLRLIYPGNEQDMFRLATYDPSLSGHVRRYLVPGSEKGQPVGDEMGKRFRVEDQASDEAGATLQHVAVVRDGTLFVLTGEGETFEEVLESFEFIEPPGRGSNPS